MSLPKKPTNILPTLQKKLPTVQFEEGHDFYWSPTTNTITYNKSALGSPQGNWSLIHEAAHALLEHKTYVTDFDLLMLEVAAWNTAKELGSQFDVTIDENYIQDCIDTYRDWLHRRSTCPTCSTTAIQHSTTEYRCHNCHSAWHVTTARFCRPYRRKQQVKEKSPNSNVSQTTFQ